MSDSEDFNAADSVNSLNSASRDTPPLDPNYHDPLARRSRDRSPQRASEDSDAERRALQREHDADLALLRQKFEGKLAAKKEELEHEYEQDLKHEQQKIKTKLRRQVEDAEEDAERSLREKRQRLDEDSRAKVAQLEEEQQRKLETLERDEQEKYDVSRAKIARDMKELKDRMERRAEEDKAELLKKGAAEGGGREGAAGADTAELERHVKKLEQDLGKAMLEADEYRMQSEKLAKRLGKAESEAANSGANAGETLALTTRLDELEKENRELKADLRDRPMSMSSDDAGTISSLKSQVARLRLELDEQMEVTAARDKTVTETSKALEVAEKVNADMRDSTIQFKAKLRQAEQRATDEQRSREEAEAEEKKLRQQQERLQESLAGLEKQLSDMRRSLAAQEALVATKDKDLSVANLSISKLSNERDHEARHLKTAKSECETSAAQIEDLQRRLSDAMAAAEAAEARVAEAKVAAVMSASGHSVGTAPDEDGEGEDPAAEEAFEDDHKVEFSVSLEDMTIDSFTHDKQAEFAADVATTMGLDASRVSVKNAYAGSLVIDVDVVGFSDPTDAAKFAETAATTAPVSEAKYGKASFAKSPAAKTTTAEDKRARASAARKGTAAAAAAAAGPDDAALAALQTQCQETAAALASTQAELGQVRLKLETQTRDMAHAHAVLEAAQADLAAVQGERDAAQQLYEKTAQEKSDLVLGIQASTRAVDQAQSDSSATAARVSALEAELAKAAAENSALTSTIRADQDTARQQQQRLEDQIASLEASRDIQREVSSGPPAASVAEQAHGDAAATAKAEAEVVRLKADLARLQVVVSQTKEDLAEVERSRTEAEAEASAARTQQQGQERQQQERVVALEQQIEALVSAGESGTGTSSAANSALELRLSIMTKDLEDARAAHTTATSHLSEEQHAKRAVMVEKHDWQAKASSAAVERDTLQSKLNQAEASCASLQERLSKALVTERELGALLRETEAAKKDAEHDLALAAHDKVQLEAKCKRVSEEKDTSAAEARELKAAVAELEHARRGSVDEAAHEAEMQRRALEREKDVLARQLKQVQEEGEWSAQQLRTAEEEKLAAAERQRKDRQDLNEAAARSAKLQRELHEAEAAVRASAESTRVEADELRRKVRELEASKAAMASGDASQQAAALQRAESARSSAEDEARRCRQEAESTAAELRRAETTMEGLRQQLKEAQEKPTTVHVTHTGGASKGGAAVPAAHHRVSSKAPTPTKASYAHSSSHTASGVASGSPAKSQHAEVHSAPHTRHTYASPGAGSSGGGLDAGDAEAAAWSHRINGERKKLREARHMVLQKKAGVKTQQRHLEKSRQQWKEAARANSHAGDNGGERKSLLREARQELNKHAEGLNQLVVQLRSTQQWLDDREIKIDKLNSLLRQANRHGGGFATDDSIASTLTQIDALASELDEVHEATCGGGGGGEGEGEGEGEFLDVLHDFFGPGRGLGMGSAPPVVGVGLGDYEYGGDDGYGYVSSDDWLDGGFSSDNGHNYGRRRQPYPYQHRPHPSEYGYRKYDQRDMRRMQRRWARDRFSEEAAAAAAARAAHRQPPPHTVHYAASAASVAAAHLAAPGMTAYHHAMPHPPQQPAPPPAPQHFYMYPQQQPAAGGSYMPAPAPGGAGVQGAVPGPAAPDTQGQLAQAQQHLSTKHLKKWTKVRHGVRPPLTAPRARSSPALPFAHGLSPHPPTPHTLTHAHAHAHILRPTSTHIYPRPRSASKRTRL